MNDELIKSAVAFLRDPNVSSSPLNKKIEFLQSKGLNEQEVEEALKQANDTAVTTSPTQQTNYSHPPQQAYPAQAPLDYYNVPPQVPDRTWKDYFIMATATAGVTYGLYQVVSRYLIPSIIPPGQSRVDEDKEKIEEEFVKIDKVLEQMALEQKEIKDSNEAKLKEIDVVISNVNDFLTKYNKDKLKFDDDLRLMKLEVDNLQNAVEKNMKLTKDNIADELTDISEELTSLRNLIKARSESASAERKVAPVSSIPLASEILKRAKSNQQTAKPQNEPVNPQNGTKSPQGEPSKSQTGKIEAPVGVKSPYASGTPSPNINSPVSHQAGGVFAAGIPDWQLKHKQAELEKEQAKDTKDTNGYAQWQQAAGQKDEDVVEKSIQNVGVPAWQLNATK